MAEIKSKEVTCNFTDIRNCWDMNKPIHLDGCWYDIQNEMIKQAAKCKNYNADVIHDIKWIQEKINTGEEFICNELFYENGVHSTLEFAGNEWTEEQKLEEMLKHCNNLFCGLVITFSKKTKRDYVLSMIERKIVSPALTMEE